MMTIMTKQKRNSALLVLTAFIWGTAFVAQSAGGDAVGPFVFNSLRFFIGGIVLLPIMFLFQRMDIGMSKPAVKQMKHPLLLGGITCGLILCISSNLQQLALYLGAPAGKAGFLTACYILLVPIIGLFFKKKCGWNIWLGVLLTLVGLYLLCVGESFSLHISDLLLMLCALGFSFHIITIDYFSPLVNGVKMSCIQFFVAGIFSLIPMFLFDMNLSFSSVALLLPALASKDALISLLYAGVFSSGIAYTLQIIGQKNVNPTIASLLMSLESVFSVLAGWILLGERLGVKELLGCTLIFCAVVLAQIPVSALKKSCCPDKVQQ